MNRRSIAVIGVVLLLVVTGCAGSAPGPDGPDAGDQRPDNGDRSTDGGAIDGGEEGESDGSTNPPGVSDGTIADREALLAAHTTSLSDTSATVSIEYELVTDDEHTMVTFSGKSVTDDDRAWVRVETTDGTGVYYTEGGSTYAKEVVDGTTYYRQVESFPGEDEPRYGADRYIELALVNAQFESVGRVNHDGRRLTGFEATAVDADDLDVGGRNVSTDMAGELLVSDEGIVHLVSVSERIETDDGRTFTFRVDVSLTDIGTTSIDRPAWYERAGGPR